MMYNEQIKSFLSSAITNVADNISNYAVVPHKDFTRTKKLPADILIIFLIAQGSSGIRNELLDFFDFERKINS